MAVARGSNFKLYGMTESSYGTAPSGDWVQLPCFSFALAASQPYQSDNVLSGSVSRDSTDPMQDVLTVQGNAVVPLDAENFGHWLLLLLGTETVSGTGPYNHIFKSGATTLPSKSFEVAMSDASKFVSFVGIKANTLAISFAPSGAAQATIGLMGQDESESGTTGAGTPTFAGMTRFHQNQASATLGGSSLTDVVAATLNFTNGMVLARTIRADLKAAGVDEGIAALTGDITVRYPDASVITAAGGAASALVLKFTNGSNVLTFTMPRAFIDRQSPTITGPNAVQVKYNFTAAFDSTAGCLFKVELDNSVASYA